VSWPLYIDKELLPDGPKTSPTLDGFTERTEIQVNYREVIQESDWFYQRIEPRLAAGEPTGWDLIVITNGITLTKLKEDGYLVELPPDKRPNFTEHAGDFVRDPAYDPGNRYTMAWQSGITGIAYDPEQTGVEITSLQSLFDPGAGPVRHPRRGCPALDRQHVHPEGGAPRRRDAAHGLGGLAGGGFGGGRPPA
jgi:spermidine/putrescine transport system substrate-binding protein